MTDIFQNRYFYMICLHYFFKWPLFVNMRTFYNPCSCYCLVDNSNIFNSNIYIGDNLPWTVKNNCFSKVEAVLNLRQPLTTHEWFASKSYTLSPCRKEIHHYLDTPWPTYLLPGREGCVVWEKESVLCVRQGSVFLPRIFQRVSTSRMTMKRVIRAIPNLHFAWCLGISLSSCSLYGCIDRSDMNSLYSTKTSQFPVGSREC